MELSVEIPMFSNLSQEICHGEGFATSRSAARVGSVQKFLILELETHWKRVPWGVVESHPWECPGMIPKVFPTQTPLGFHGSICGMGLGTKGAFPKIPTGAEGRGGAWGWLGKVLVEPSLLNPSFTGQEDVQVGVSTAFTCWDALGNVLDAALGGDVVGNPVCAGIITLEFLAFKREYLKKPGEY